MHAGLNTRNKVCMNLIFFKRENLSFQTLDRVPAEIRCKVLAKLSLQDQYEMRGVCRALANDLHLVKNNLEKIEFTVSFIFE